VPSIVEIAKEFRIEAAHFLPHVPDGHQCKNIHGHSYTITLKIKGPINISQGWLMDLSIISQKFEPLQKKLDHSLLNNINGLENPTSENLAIWILRYLLNEIPLLDSVTVNATNRLAVTVNRQDIDLYFIMTLQRVSFKTFKSGFVTYCLVFLVSGCATLSHTKLIKNVTQKPHVLRTDDRAKIVTIAQNSLGKKRVKVTNEKFRDDCSGTVRAIFAKANIWLGGIIKQNFENDVKAIYRYVKKYGKIIKSNPTAGDLIFFHNTYDRSRNGNMNDALTHMGIVEKVDGNTVHFIHHLGQSIIRSRMDMSFPHNSFHPITKQRINHVLRRAKGKNKAYTAAELFAGFGRL
jgi:6-pyruvoyltetrahydropterin/6-carboxytetrahydropterin synthase